MSMAVGTRYGHEVSCWMPPRLALTLRSAPPLAGARSLASIFDAAGAGGGGAAHPPLAVTSHTDAWSPLTGADLLRQAAGASPATAANSPSATSPAGAASAPRPPPTAPASSVRCSPTSTPPRPFLPLPGSIAGAGAGGPACCQTRWWRPTKQRDSQLSLCSRLAVDGCRGAPGGAALAGPPAALLLGFLCHAHMKWRGG